MDVTVSRCILTVPKKEVTTDNKNYKTIVQNDTSRLVQSIGLRREIRQGAENKLRKGCMTRNSV